MSARTHCELPGACRAKREGHCRSCSGRLMAARLNSDPEIDARKRKASSATLTALHRHPKFAAAHQARMREQRRDPEFCAKFARAASAAVRAVWADPVRRAAQIAAQQAGRKRAKERGGADANAMPI